MALRPLKFKQKDMRVNSFPNVGDIWTYTYLNGTSDVFCVNRKYMDNGEFCEMFSIQSMVRWKVRTDELRYNTIFWSQTCKAQ